jgi:hypothetical protein
MERGLCAECSRVVRVFERGPSRPSRALCPSCRERIRGAHCTGFTRTGASFYIWDSDARAASAWAGELRGFAVGLRNRRGPLRA